MLRPSRDQGRGTRIARRPRAVILTPVEMLSRPVMLRGLPRSRVGCQHAMPVCARLLCSHDPATKGVELDEPGVDATRPPAGATARTRRWLRQRRARRRHRLRLGTRSCIHGETALSTVDRNPAVAQNTRNRERESRSPQWLVAALHSFHWIRAHSANPSR